MKVMHSMSPSRLEELISRFGLLHIAVVGDFFLDKYLEVDPQLAELSVESGRTAHQVTAIRHSPGAAGTVICNLAALGAGKLYAIGFTGEDGESFDLRSDLHHLECITTHLHVAPDRMTPTYLKPRNQRDPSLAGEHERYDTKNRTPTPPVLDLLVIASLESLLPHLDAVIIADQVEEDNCGVVTKRVRHALEDLAEQFPQVVFWADSRTHIRQFRRVIIKPNQFEAVSQDSPLPGEKVDPDALQTAVLELRKEVGAPVCATCGAAGMVVSEPELTLVPGVQVEGEIDPTGAGDSATAGAVMALAAGATLPEAALAGNLVASLTIQQLATTGTASPDQVRERLGMWTEQQKK